MTGESDKPVLLSGGNPQIAKGDGDAPVKAWIAAVPGWKSETARRLDALIETTAPGVRKAVKWNTPMYGMEEKHWFIAYHAFDNYLKVTFFKGQALEPQPPVGSKVAGVRYLHITEDGVDEAQLTDWIRQAAALPGEKM